MRTSLNEIKRAEDFLGGNMSGEESALFQSKMILNPSLRIDVAVQKMLYKLVRDFGRRTTKKQVEELHQQLFTNPDKKNFQEEIHREFNPH